MSGPSCSDNRAPYLSLLSKEQIERIHCATLDVLEKTGVVFQHAKALEILGSTGCSVEKDLVDWDSSSLNPVLLASDEDKQVLNPKLTLEQRERVRTARNVNNSDIDFCEFQGELVINYSWGNQRGVEHLAEARYEGTLEKFLTGWYPSTEESNGPAQNKEK